MRDFLNRQVVDIVKSNVSQEENMVDVIMSILSLGKEAAYRRIRGEVLFTFSEIAKLSNHFEFSLDSIAGMTHRDMAVVNMHIFNFNQLYDDYRQVIKEQLRLFKELNASTNPKISMAFNTIPFAFYSRFKALSIFKLYKIMHQSDMDPSGISFSGIDELEDIWDLHQEIKGQVDLLRNTCYVFDRNIFSAFVNDINHFIQLGLIKPEDCQLLKKELFALLDFFESIVREGGITPQNNVSIYISNIDIDSSYTYYETDDFSYCDLRIYSVGIIHTKDKKICETHKKMIDSLKRYSVLISGCGEMERVKFISKQRELINLL